MSSAAPDSVRLARTSDVDDIARVQVAAWRAAYAGVLGSGEWFGRLRQGLARHAPARTHRAHPLPHLHQKGMALVGRRFARNMQYIA